MLLKKYENAISKTWIGTSHANVVELNFTMMYDIGCLRKLAQLFTFIEIRVTSIGNEKWPVKTLPARSYWDVFQVEEIDAHNSAFTIMRNANKPWIFDKLFRVIRFASSINLEHRLILYWYSVSGECLQ